MHVLSVSLNADIIYLFIFCLFIYSYTYLLSCYIKSILHCISSLNIGNHSMSILPCCMTLCFSFEVLMKLKISKEEGLRNNNQGGGTKICTITSRFRKLQ